MRLGLREKDFEDCRLIRAKVRRGFSSGEHPDESTYNEFVQKVLFPNMRFRVQESTFVKRHLTKHEASKCLVGVNLDEDTYNKFIEEGWSFNERTKTWTLEKNYTCTIFTTGEKAEPDRFNYSFNEETEMWTLETEEKYYNDEEKSMLGKYSTSCNKYLDVLECWHYDDKGRERVYQHFYKSRW